MIDWKEWNPEKPPEHGKEYLVTDGQYVEIAMFNKYTWDDYAEWYLPDRSAIDGAHDITHYAEINLPGGAAKEIINI